MSSKLIPSNPDEVMVIRDLAPNTTTFSVPFARFGRIQVGGRGTLLRLSSGNLVVFSPVALTETVKAKVASTGTGQVAYIVAPDIEHHIFVSSWLKEWPAAKVIGPDGLPEKRAKTSGDPMINPEDKFDFVFTAENKSTLKISDEFDADIEIEYVDAHPSREIVLFFRPDRVVLEADLMFNLPAKEQYSRMPEAEREPKGLLNRIFGSVQTTQGDLKWVHRFQWHALGGKKPGFTQSIQRIDGWDFDTVVPCHGDTMVGDGKDRFRGVFEWHLTGSKAEGEQAKPSN